MTAIEMLPDAINRAALPKKSWVFWRSKNKSKEVPKPVQLPPALRTVDLALISSLRSEPDRWVVEPGVGCCWRLRCGPIWFSFYPPIRIGVVGKFWILYPGITDSEQAHERCLDERVWVEAHSLLSVKLKNFPSPSQIILEALKGVK